MAFSHLGLNDDLSESDWHLQVFILKGLEVVHHQMIGWNFLVFYYLCLLRKLLDLFHLELVE